MAFDLVVDLARLALFVAGAWAAIGVWARLARPPWARRLTHRRLTVVALLVLAAVAAKVTEDVVAHESGPVDTLLLWWVRDHVPAALAGFFAAVTLSGSAAFPTSATVLATIAFVIGRHRFEAALLAASMLTAVLFVYGLKTVTARSRPALWENAWSQLYWGSSFPSGHTLCTATFSTALALCVARLRPRLRTAALAIAIVWSALVALSRLVLGVHWPSDVLAALCLGFFIPLAISVAFDARRLHA